MPSTRSNPTSSCSYLLAIDTAGSRALLALGRLDGSVVAESRWIAGFRHGEELLVRLQALLDENEIGLDSIAGIVTGTGPGAFTGLRVGLATAKALASGLSIPLVGVPTGEALLAAAGAGAVETAGETTGRSVGQATASRSRAFALLLPAGPSDRVVVTANGGEPAARIVRAGDDLDLGGRVAIAVDLEGRADPDALERGRRAEEGLARSLLRLGAAKLSRTGGDDVARLVPEYVTLPRGVQEVAGEVRWSRTR